MARAALLFAAWGGSRTTSHAAAAAAASEARRSPPMPLHSALAALPRDVLETVAACLVGGDLLQLARVSRVFHAELLADAARWAALLPQANPSDSIALSCAEAKHAYASHRAFKFRGQPKADAQARGACVEALRFLPSSSQRDVQLFVPLAPRTFSIDVWFGLHAASESSDVYQGGILLGAQSARWQDAVVWPDYHQQFIHVDRDCNLYCSVVGDKRAVASRLETRRWYHLVLVFDGDHERVFLDGALVRRSDGALHRDWRSLYFMQVGTGCISAGHAGAPSSAVSGWYAFNGLVHELRIWEHALAAPQVARLARNEAVEATPAGRLTACEASASYLGHVERVHSSLPRERTCVEWAK